MAYFTHGTFAWVATTTRRHTGVFNINFRNQMLGGKKTICRTLSHVPLLFNELKRDPQTCEHLSTTRSIFTREGASNTQILILAEAPLRFVLKVFSVLRRGRARSRLLGPNCSSESNTRCRILNSKALSMS